MRSNDAKSYAKVVQNGVQVVHEIEALQYKGYSEDQIFVLAHDQDRTDSISEEADAPEIGVTEEGMMTSVPHLFRSRGDGLRAKIAAFGFEEEEADYYERELDLGNVLVIAKPLT